MRRGVAGLLLAGALAGGSPVRIEPAYTQEELARMCARGGGWWHPDELTGGFCEFTGPGLP
jgi:hypothetical protein